jgi:hypothetical protein
MPKAVFWVLVNGMEITNTLEPLLMSLSISDGEGNKSDSMELTLDAQGQDIEFPPTNAPIQGGIGWEDEAGGPVGPPVQFSGKVDKCSVGLARGQGLVLTVSCKSADVKGKPKEHQEKHHDKGKLSDVAKKWGKDAGLTVKVATGIDVERVYWAMQGESFLHWGARIAEEVGGTFKVRGDQAVIAERSSGQSIDGQSLPTIQATYGKNIISGNMSPEDDRQDWKKHRVRYYDQKAAKYKYKDVDTAETDGATVTHLHRFNHADEDSAEARGKSNSKEAEREQGGGSIVIVGEPSAQAECMCEVSGIYPGIDGTYRVATAVHKLDRGSGYTTELTLKQPKGKAGKDTRKATAKTAGKADAKAS